MKSRTSSIVAGLIVAGCLSVSWYVARPAHGVAGLTPTTQQADQKAADKTADTTPVNKNCAVETDQPIDPNVTVVYNGKTYGFCCQDCVKKFNADPEKYAANAK